MAHDSKILKNVMAGLTKKASATTKTTSPTISTGDYIHMTT